jgi:predicted thioesterase
LAATVELKVEDADTASALRSGDVAMLGTPRLVGLVEEATVAALAGHLESGMTTVGMRVQLDHLIPTPVGHSVRAEAKLDKVEGRRLTFSFAVTSDRGLVSAGRVVRVLVNRERFLDRAQ